MRKWLILLLVLGCSLYLFAQFTAPGRGLLRKWGILAFERSCEFGKPAQCPAEELCTETESGPSICVRRYVGPTPFVMFPFDPNHGVVCSQGPLSKHRKHSLQTTLYAVDLASPESSPPGTIFSALEGTALVYRSCANGSPPAEAGQSPNDDPCGGGFGNHVRVFNPHQGLMVLYAHMGAVWVQDGQVVRIGEAIGKEGKSGKAGYRHLHFSVHHAPVESWLETLYYYRNRPGALPPSIPFETQYCDPSDQQRCIRKRTRVEQLPCSDSAPPSLKGPVLRADLRN